MTIEFKYSVVYDLMYHILAHMKVENASNLYSEAYIDNVNKTKNGRYNSIIEVYHPPTISVNCLTQISRI